MKIMLTLLAVFCAASSFSQEESKPAPPGKLPDEPFHFNYAYKADDVRNFGIHMSNGVYVVFSGITRADGEWRDYDYAYKIDSTLSEENGLECALLLSRQLDEASSVCVRSPHHQQEHRIVKINNKAYLIVGSLSFFK